MVKLNDCDGCACRDSEIQRLKDTNIDLLAALEYVMKSLALAAPMLGASWELPEIKQARAAIAKAKGLDNE